MSKPPINLLTPFRRDRKSDFASGSGPSLTRSKVLQILLTEGDTPQTSGELPWRTAFGAGLHLLRHRRNDAALAQLARVRVRDALRRWLPSNSPVQVEATTDENSLVLSIRLAGEHLELKFPRER